jgi:hypothetical protein
VPQSVPACTPPAKPGASVLDLRRGITDESERLAWTWRGQTTLADFGAPEVDDDLELCVYSPAGNPTQVFALAVPAGGTCGRRSCWTRVPGRRLSYRDPLLTPDGIASIVLQSQRVGGVRITLRGKGAGLGMNLPFVLPVRVQLQAEHGGCWEASYSTASPADAHRLRAASD